MLRSILAVIAGSITWMVTALGTDNILLLTMPHWFDEKGGTDKLPVLLFMGFYSLFFSALGGYVTAVIAGHNEIKHTLALGVLQLAMGIMATISHWDLAPVWYHIIFLILLVPANILGGWLRLYQKENASTGRLRAV